MKRSSVRKRVGSIKKSFNDRHPFVVPVVTLFFLIIFFSVGFLIFGGKDVAPADSKIVNLYVDGERRTIPTRASTVREMLDNSGVEYTKKDLIEPGLDTQISGRNFSVNIYRAKQVTVVDENGKTVTAKVPDTTPVVMATAAGFKLYPEDIVEIEEPDISLGEGVIGTKVIINRATPIQLNLYGKNYNIRTHAETVADLINERNLTVDGNSVLPKPGTKLKPNDVVFITDINNKIALVEEQIAQPIEYISAADLIVGVEEVREEGRPGKKVVVYSIGDDGSRVPLQEIIVTNPVRKLVARGTKPDPANNFDGSFEAALAALRSCEGSYSSATGNGYYGAYQFDIGTWGGYGGYPNAAAAPPIVQDQKAWETYQARGWSPWPSCSVGLGLQDIYR